jgi:geranylgeranyl pyrophosphate synthase
VSEINLKEYLSDRKELVNGRLRELMAGQDLPAAKSKLAESMSYSLFGGGKRFRPILLIACHELFAPLTAYALDVACALELLHTYSLIHDDLPSFDNDDLRRGRATCHLKFGEWTAILSGDGLNTLAFKVLAGSADDVPADRKLEAIRIVAEAAGPLGMVLGQAMDMAFENETHSADEIALMQSLKTGCLITAPAELGAVLADAPEDDRRKMKEYGRMLGRAFQIKDDLLDLEGSEAELGKHNGKDDSAGKATLPAIIGVEEARKLADRLVNEAHGVLEPYGANAAILRALADYVVARRF